MQRTVDKARVNNVVQNPHRAFVAMLKICRILMQMLRMAADRLLIEALSISEQFHVRSQNCRNDVNSSFIKSGAEERRARLIIHCQHHNLLIARVALRRRQKQRPVRRAPAFNNALRFVQ